jgi:hypothetical protein
MMVKVTLKGTAKQVARYLRGPVFEDLYKSRLGNFPSRQPIGISAKAWFYEERIGINIFAELRTTDGKYLGTTQTLIRWSIIEKSLARHLRAKARRPMGNAARSAGLHRQPKGKA